MSLPQEKATYRAKAVNTGFGVSDNENATKYIAVGFEVLDEGFAGETITALLYFTDKTTARTIESLQHMGFNSDDLAVLEDLDRDGCAQHLPAEVDIVCDVEEYKGEWQLKVKWVNRVGAGRFKAKQPLVGNDLKAFAAQMKGALRNARSAPPQRKPNGGSTQARHPNAPSPKDDDLPFASCALAAEPSAIAKVLR